MLSSQRSRNSDHSTPFFFQKYGDKWWQKHWNSLLIDQHPLLTGVNAVGPLLVISRIRTLDHLTAKTRVRHTSVRICDGGIRSTPASQIVRSCTLQHRRDCKSGTPSVSAMTGCFPCVFLSLENKMSLDWANLVSIDSIQPGHSQSEVRLGVQ